MLTCRYTATGCALFAIVACGGVARADHIVVGGTATTNIITALNDLGEAFTLVAGIPAPGAGHIIIIGMDGGIEPMPDYNAWLDAGGDLIVTGGSNWQPYRDWVSEYFNTTDTAGGWHTDGDWHKLSGHKANVGLPDDYTFSENGHTFHMLGFLATPNTTLLGNNDEPNNIAAIRDYNNLGTFNYMALDLGIRAGDQAEFITPWVAAALNAARIPAPATLSFLAVGGLLGLRRRRRARLGCRGDMG